MYTKFKVKNLIDDSWIYNKIPGSIIIKGNTVSLESEFTDINSNRIFEGDIVKSIYKDLYKNKKFSYFKITYIDSKFIAINIENNKKVKLKDLIYYSDIEKIKNIF